LGSSLGDSEKRNSNPTSPKTRMRGREAVRLVRGRQSSRKRTTSHKQVETAKRLGLRLLSGPRRAAINHRQKGRRQSITDLQKKPQRKDQPEIE